MHLPQILEAWGCVERFHHIRASTFTRSIVHDGDLRLKRVHQYFGIRGVLSMMQAEKNIDRADAIRWAHQLELLVLCEITQVKRTELAKRHETPH